MFDDIVKEFPVESYENLDQLDKDLLALEEAPDDRSRLSSIFRTIHTIKGNSGLLAFPKLEHVTHVGENLLVQFQDGALRLNAEITSGLLSMVDAVRSILGQIDSTGMEGGEAYEVLFATLGRLKSGKSAAAAVPEAAASEQAEIEVEQVIRELSKDIAAAVSESTTKSKKTKGSKAKSKAVSAEATRVAVPVPAVMISKPTVHVSENYEHDHPVWQTGSGQDGRCRRVCYEAIHVRNSDRETEADWCSVSGRGLSLHVSSLIA
jgi:two-component system chemotaxis sensor kinase CheA